MHLGEERSVMKKTILIPYLVFIVYLVFIAITEGFGHLYNLTNFH